MGKHERKQLINITLICLTKKYEAKVSWEIFALKPNQPVSVL